MARPKEKTSSAFQDKCTAAADKLRKFQAESLTTDITRLVEDVLHSDVTISMDGGPISFHNAIITARSAGVYEWLTSLVTEGTTSLSHLPAVTQRHAVQCLRQLYTVEDIGPVLQELDACLFSHMSPDSGDVHSEDGAHISTSKHTQDTLTNGAVPIGTQDTLTNGAEPIRVEDAQHNGAMVCTSEVMSKETLHSISENITNFSLDS